MDPADVARFFSDAPDCPDVTVQVRSTPTGAVVATVDGVHTIDMLRCQRFALWVMARVGGTLVPELELKASAGGITIRVTVYPAPVKLKRPKDRFCRALCRWLMACLLFVCLCVCVVMWCTDQTPEQALETCKGIARDVTESLLDTTYAGLKGVLRSASRSASRSAASASRSAAAAAAAAVSRP